MSADIKPGQSNRVTTDCKVNKGSLSSGPEALDALIKLQEISKDPSNNE